MPDTEIAYPAVAASEAILFVLAYKVEIEKTSIVLFSSTDDGLSFQAISVLDERRFRPYDFCSSAKPGEISALLCWSD